MFFFSKMQATGNDFIVLNYLENKLEYSFKLLSEFLCNRHYGVGADGILIIEESKLSDFKMRTFNQDGSEAEMCGNGIRCFAKYVYEKELTNKKEFTIETLGGIKKVKLEVEGSTVISVSVDMGNPVLDFNKIPVFYSLDTEEMVDEETKTDTENVEGFGKNNVQKLYIQGLEVYPISMGNPHAVCFVENVDEFDVHKFGKQIEESKYFPNKTNVEFVQILDNKNIKVRVWERGVGETLACGTGACGSAVIANKFKNTDSELNVELLGGKLNIKILENVILKGPAEFVFEGKIEV